MRKYWTTVLSVVAGSLLLVSAAAGDEPQVDKLRGRADEMMRDVQQLHEQGKHDEAQRLDREVAELREQAERIARGGDQQPGPGEVIANRLRELSQQWGDQQPGREENWQQKVQETKKKIEGLRQQGKQDLADRLVKELDQMRDRRAEGESRDGGKEKAKPREQQQREHAERETGASPRPEGRPGLGPDQRADMERRVHHLRAAAENLNAIGMKDVAERLNREAEEIQKAFQNPPPQGEDLHRGVMEVMQQEFRNLHQRLDELNRRLDELTETIRRDR